MRIINTNFIENLFNTNGCRRLLTQKQNPITCLDKFEYKPAIDNVISKSQKRYTKVCGLRSMQNIKGIEREIIEAYKAELTHDIWGDTEKLKKWALKKTEEIATKEYPSDMLDNITLREGRTDAVDKWYQFLQNDRTANRNPFLKLKVMRFVTENLKNNNKQLAPVLNPKVASDALFEVNKTGKSLKKTYYEMVREFDKSPNVKTEEISENGVLGKWYTIDIPDTNSAKRNIKHFQEIKKYVAVLSQGSNWCIRSPYTVGREFGNCIIHIFVDNKGTPQICMSTMGKNNKWFEYIRGNDQYAPIQEKFKNIIKTFLNRQNIKDGMVGKIGAEEPIMSFLG